MAIDIVAYTGTEDVGATEWSMTTDTAGPDNTTAAGVYQAVIDLSDMVAADVLLFRVYEKARAADTQRKTHEVVFVHAQGIPNWISEALLLGAGWDMTLQATTGTVTVPWSIRKVS